MSEALPPDDFADEHTTFPHRRVVKARGWRVAVVAPAGGGSVLLDGSEPGPTLVGQSEACALRVLDRTVSRRHLALELDGSRLRLRDLGSTNGTRVNGVLVVEAVLEEAGTVELGDARLGVEPVSREAPPVLSEATSFGGVVGASAAMRRLYPLCAKLAASDIPVVIEGETGTGKEALAEALHTEGRRAEGPFVVFDCTAVPANLMEAELFGHARGAFTGATEARRGVFVEADGGTLLIDEIGDLDLALQPKLLRAIDRGEVRPIGANRAVKVDVRVLAATRRDLDREIAAGRFRDDLFHRLAVARVELPPLRARGEDVARLAQHFARALGGAETDLPAPLLRRWAEAPWPGNVRELRNAVARHLALGELAALADGPRGATAAAAPGEGLPWESLLAVALGDARAQVVERFEREYVRRMLERHDGNVTRAAKAAGIARRYFQILKARQRDEGPSGA